MSAICSGCPVLVRCARHAVEGKNGGFYAGVWLPWWNSSADGARNSRERHRAMETLRSIVRRAAAVGVR